MFSRRQCSADCSSAQRFAVRLLSLRGGVWNTPAAPVTFVASDDDEPTWTERALSILSAVRRMIWQSRSAAARERSNEFRFGPLDRCRIPTLVPPGEAIVAPGFPERKKVPRG